MPTANKIDELLAGFISELTEQEGLELVDKVLQHFSLAIVPKLSIDIKRIPKTDTKNESVEPDIVSPEGTTVE